MTVWRGPLSVPERCSYSIDPPLKACAAKGLYSWLLAYERMLVAIVTVVASALKICLLARLGNITGKLAKTASSYSRERMLPLGHRAE